MLACILTITFSTPVWTAFVTQYLGRRGWLRQLDSKTVLVRDLDPVILMSADDYNPPQTQNGEHILKFTSRGGECVIPNDSQSWY